MCSTLIFAPLICLYIHLTYTRTGGEPVQIEWSRDEEEHHYQNYHHLTANHQHRYGTCHQSR
jgi:hypothetical protein